MTEKAKFKYSASEGFLELEGSEEFVTKHFESLTDMVRVISRHVPVETKTDSAPVTPVPADVSNGTPTVNETVGGGEVETINSYQK